MSKRGRGKLFLAGFIALLLLIHFPQFANAKKKKNHPCAPSSCGTIHNISYPFRLKEDPENCGDSRCQLVCEDNLTVLYLFSQKKYHVQEINYDNFTIRLVDANLQKDNCSSIPRYSLTSSNFGPKDGYAVHKHKWHENFSEINKPVIFMSCPYPLKSSLFVDASSCSTHGVSNISNDSFFPSVRRHYSYVRVGDLNASDVRDQCSIDLTVMTSWPFKDDHDENLSFSLVHEALVYGFELSWFKVQNEGCGKCGYCYLDDANKVIVVDDGYCLGYSKWGILDSVPAICYFLVTGIIPSGIVLCIAARIFCGMPCTLAFFIYKFRRRHLSMFDDIEGYLQSQDNLLPIRYSNWEIKRMTKNFKEKLGEGGYGSVYKGKLRSGRLVAVKMLGKSKADGQDFINEVGTVGRIHHVNVVRLIGYCSERRKRALVYDFMPNGSLEKYIFRREGCVPLSWERKYEIVLGVARGIEYLHRGCDIQILHFDIKPHNILLDEDFVPKVSDFGLAKFYSTDKSAVTLTAARGTIGYVAPELINRSIGAVSYKADVYSFGMLLIEMTGLRKNLAPTEDSSSQYFPFWIYDRFNRGKDIEMGDATDDYDDEEEEEKKKIITKRMTIVALWCIQTNPVDRPSMSRVLEMLEGPVELLQMPSEPFQSPRDAVSSQQQTWTEDSTESLSLLYNQENKI